MVVEVNMVALEVGNSVVIDAGKTLRVAYSFTYKVAETATVPVWASLYTIGIPIDRIEQAQTKTTVTLDQSIEWQTYRGQVDIIIGTGTPGGVYGLIVELPGFKNAEARLEGVIQVIGAPGIFDSLGQLATLAILGLVVRLVTNTTKGASK